MRLNAWPPAEVVEPAAGVFFAGLEDLAQAEPGRAVLVVASARARREDWCVATFTAIAEALVGAGRRVLVADLTFDHTNLADQLTVPNDEGLADVFLYGASLGHVIHKVPDHSFDLVPPGAFIPDPGDLMRDRGWDALLEEILLQGRTLVVYAAAEVAGITALSTRIRDIVVLTSSGESEAIAGLLADGCRVYGVLMPPPAPVIPAPVRPVREPTPVEPPAPRKDFEAIRLPKDAEREALIADLRARQRAALMAPPPPPTGSHTGSDPSRVEPAPGDPLFPEPFAGGDVTGGTGPLDPAGMRPPEFAGVKRPGRRGLQPVQPPITEPTFADAMELRPPRKGRRALYFGLSFLTVVALVAAAWIVVIRSRNTPAAPVVTEVPAAPPPRSSPRVLSFAVAVEAHQHLPLAFERVTALRREEPSVGFYIAPFLIGNELWYRVLAGPVADSAAGSALLTYLLEKRYKTGSTPNDLRHDPLAFLIGEFPENRDAERRRQEIEALGIPGYIVPSVAPDGGALYRLYAGAYSGTAEANIMRQLLRSAGLPDSLVERTGR